MSARVCVSLRVARVRLRPPPPRLCAATGTRLLASESRPPPPSTPPSPPPSRPAPARALPSLAPAWPPIVVACVLGVTLWGGFLLYATNAEKLASSVVTHILATVRDSPALADALGSPVAPEPQWYLNGAPRVHGDINQLKGKIDLTLRLVGSRAAGTLYFSSIRTTKGAPFRILRFRVICDDGTVVHLDPSHIVSLAATGRV